MSVGTICKVTGAVTIIWFIGGFEFIPKLMADIGQWDGVDSINRIFQSGGRAIASQFDKKLGNAKPLPESQNKVLGTDICKPNTVTPNARLPLKVYEEHERAIKLKVRSPLMDKNQYVFCEWKDNAFGGRTLGHNELVYIPGWKEAQGKALITNSNSFPSNPESSQHRLIDLDNGQPKP
jgi:hypothetical protein